MKTSLVAKQVEYMRREWPYFRVCSKLHWYVSWEGTVTPLCQEYKIRVSCRFNGKPKKVRPPQPHVTVINPLLRRRPQDPATPIPHIYQNESYPEKPILCLYDPMRAEWNFNYAISDTIIPWAADWLACYEGWLATGEWTGGGRH